MIPRTRTRERLQSGGLAKVSGAVIAGPITYRTVYWKCDDWIQKKRTPEGLLPSTPFYLQKSSYKPPIINFRRTYTHIPNVAAEFTSLPGAAPGSSLSEPPNGWVSLEGTEASLVAKLLSDTNPFRYEVSVPIMLSELLEAGSLLKLAGGNLISLVGSGHLNWVFGWQTLISDLKSLAGITKTIESRIREFNSLIKKGGLRRRRKLASGSKTVNGSLTAISSLGGYAMYAYPTTTYKTKVWGTVRWKPQRDKEIEIAKLANFNEACKVVFDLGMIDASTIWEAIPFSWLVDYFLNVGDVLNALETKDLVMPTDINIMRHRRIETYGDPKLDTLNGTSGVNVYSCQTTPSEVRHDLKYRSCPVPDYLGSLLSFGLMSKAQATNLVALLASLVRFKG